MDKHAPVTKPEVKPALDRGAYLISDYKPKHREAVLALWKIHFPNSPESVFTRDIDYAVDSGLKLFVTATTFPGGHLVGTSLGAYDGYRGWIYYLCVNEEFQRMSLGTKLLGATEQRLISIGAHQVSLHMRKDNPASHFYLRYGYIEEDVVSYARSL